MKLTEAEVAAAVRLYVALAYCETCRSDITGEETIRCHESARHLVSRIVDHPKFVRATLAGD